MLGDAAALSPSDKENSSARNVRTSSDQQTNLDLKAENERLRRELARRRENERLRQENDRLRQELRKMPQEDDEENWHTEGHPHLKKRAARQTAKSLLPTLSLSRHNSLFGPTSRSQGSNRSSGTPWKFHDAGPCAPSGASSERATAYTNYV